MALSPLEAVKLAQYKTKFGQMSSMEALECSINDDIIYSDLSPFDPAKSRFAQSRNELLNYAELLEKAKS